MSTKRESSSNKSRSVLEQSVEKHHDKSQKGVSEKSFGGPSLSSSLESSGKCMYDSRLSDSGVWSGSNIHSEEISVPESPISKSKEFSYMPTSHKVSDDNKTSNYMRLDSGIDVSQHFSGLSINDEDCYNDLSAKNITLRTSESSSSSVNINEQLPSNVKTAERSSELTVLDQYFQQNDDGDTYLHVAIIDKFIEAVFALVRMVPSPKYLNIRNNDRQTPLHLAVLTHQPRLVRLLVCAGSSQEELDRYGNTALHLAVQSNDISCVRALIDPVATSETQQAQLQYTPLYHAKRIVPNIYNYDGQTCLHLAALNGNIDIFRCLLWTGADLNAKEWKGGQTCLHLAVERKDLDLCVFLLSQEGLDVEETSYAGHTAYRLACEAWDSRPAIAEALRRHGVDTYDADTDTGDDDDDMVENSFGGSFHINGGGLVDVGA